MDSLAILGHPIEIETLDSNDWPHVTPLQVNPNAEKLAAQGTVHTSGQEPKDKDQKQLAGFFAPGPVFRGM